MCANGERKREKEKTHTTGIRRATVIYLSIIGAPQSGERLRPVRHHQDEENSADRGLWVTEPSQAKVQHRCSCTVSRAITCFDNETPTSSREKEKRIIYDRRKKGSGERFVTGHTCETIESVPWVVGGRIIGRE